jgi:hypothetical protein
MLAAAACAIRAPIREPLTFWPAALFGDDGRPQFEATQTATEVGARAHLRPPACGPAVDQAGIVARLGVLSRTGVCAYEVVVPQRARPYIVEHGQVQSFDAPDGVFDRDVIAVGQLGESILITMPYRVAVFSASTRRYLGMFGVASSSPDVVSDGPGSAILVLDGEGVRLRPTASGRALPAELESVEGWDQEALASPFSLFDGKAQTEALLAGRAELTLHLARPILEPHICIAAREPFVRAIARVWIGSDEQAVPVEGTSGADRVPTRPALPVFVDRIRLSLSCASGAVCHVADIDIGCSRTRRVGDPAPDSAARR